MSSVLFVDDDALMRDLYANLEEVLGKDFSVRTVASGAEALKVLADAPAERAI